MNNIGTAIDTIYQGVKIGSLAVDCTKLFWDIGGADNSGIFTTTLRISSVCAQIFALFKEVERDKVKNELSKKNKVSENLKNFIPGSVNEKKVAKALEEIRANISQKQNTLSSLQYNLTALRVYVVMTGVLNKIVEEGGSMEVSELLKDVALDKAIQTKVGLLLAQVGSHAKITSFEILAQLITTAPSMHYLVCNLKNVFANWYEVRSAQSPGLDLDNLDYEPIPEEFEDDEILKNFICPITQAPMRYPVTAPNDNRGPDHHFERRAILAWLQNHNTHPITRAPLNENDLRENLEMRAIIEMRLGQLMELNNNDD